MKRCDEFKQAVLDESVPRPAGFEAHPASCPGCRALAHAHTAAKRLHGAEVPQRAQIPVAKVATRLAVLSAVLLAGVVVAFEEGRSAPAPVPVAVKTLDRDAPAPERTAASAEGTLTASHDTLDGLNVVDDGWAALGELDAFASRVTRTNPSLEPAYAANDVTASYLLMRRQQPLSGLGTRLPSLVSTSEE